MNKEELKAIEYTKSILEFPKLYASTEIVGNFLRGIDKEKLNTLLNLIEKQQKEIENSISKDKIRETIDRYSMNLEFDYRPMEVIETKEINKLLEE